MTADATTRSWQYIAAFDGLRALAVAAVVGFHFWPDVFPGGFLGVDIFFVMSGYLITGLLVEEHRSTGGVRLKAFWGRRIRRLVPAAWFLVAVCAVWMTVIGTATFRAFADSIGALTWTTNIVELAFAESRAFRVDDGTVLDHLWSLAIEEQFYLVWPVILVGLFRYLPSRKTRILITGTLGVASVVSMALSANLTAYFSTHTRGFELLAGAILSMSGVVLGRWSARLAMVGGLAAMVAMIATMDPGADYMYPWGFIGVTVMAVVLVSALSSPLGSWSAPFTTPAVRHIGVVSFGIYLWHIPVLRFLSIGRTGLEGFALTALRFVVLVVLVEFSYHVIENPIRSRQWRLTPAVVAAFALVVLGSLVPLGFEAQRGWVDRWDSQVPQPQVTDGDTKVLVLGDLVGAVAARGLSDAEGLATWNVTDVGCGYVDAGYLREGELVEPDRYCNEWPTRWTHAIEDFDPDVIVVSVGYWDLGDRFDLAETTERDKDALKPLNATQLYREAAATAQRTIADAAPDTPVVLIPVADLDSFAPRVTDGSDVSGSLEKWNDAFDAEFGSRGALLLPTAGSSTSDAALSFLAESGELLADLAACGQPAAECEAVSPR